ncbi:MAG TPA: LytTR family transcriptional regulator DNA-binding domain-containing protein [Bacteroidales bacterium]|nr:LytTR family transcriptional regulator DNA-binding domain-containing protein [Bacteroidales bacterium]
MKLSVIIVDDEKPARDIIASYAAQRSDLEMAGECQNGFEAIKMINELKPDLIFLDIQMPKVDGFELLEVLEYRPAVIFCTAYDHFAVKAFEKSAVDYLLKPFSEARFNEAVDKLILQKKQSGSAQEKVISETDSLREESGEKVSRVVARLGSNLHVIQVSDIRFVESQDDYVLIHCSKGDFLKEKTMNYFEKNLPEEFLRIHRSYIVNIQCIDKVELYEKDTHLVTLKTGEKLRASREGYKKLRALL